MAFASLWHMASTRPGAKNRDLSRKGDLGPEDTSIPENLLKSSDYRKKELEEIINIRRGEKKPDKTWDGYYWWSPILFINVKTILRRYACILPGKIM
jgi:hypothetical protein